jgi:3beta-hydroxy-delta5-steroid dehydrogenase/steroid delta-isomerase
MYTEESDKALEKLSPALGHCLVTGSAGLVGSNLVKALLTHGCKVRAVVHRTPLPIEHPNLQCIPGDVTDAQAMSEACIGIKTVFHVASMISLLGGKSATSRYRQPVWDVNVGGTQNLLNASQAQGVERFVYTSSADVCFDGDPLPDMDQSTPYAKKPKSVYAETKIEAEKRVLAANGKDQLRTSAIRPDGIYGPEENLILDAIVVQLAKSGLPAAMGLADTRQDNSYVANVVHGALLAALHLEDTGTACGKAYFISDYAPQNTFEFLRPVIEGLNCPFPKKRIPGTWIMPLLVLWEHLHFRLGFPEPLIAPHELDKVTVTHFGSIRDAERDLGYAPARSYEQAIQECLPYCQDLFNKIRNKKRGIEPGA